MIDHTLLKADATARRGREAVRRGAQVPLRLGVRQLDLGAASRKALLARLGRDGLRGGRLPARRDDADRQGLRGARGGAPGRRGDRHGHQHRRAQVARLRDRVRGHLPGGQGVARRPRSRSSSRPARSTHEEKIIGMHAVASSPARAFVKTSTGFGPGGATVEDIALMRRLVGDEMGVKASGGVRTHEDAEKMRAAGANRIGASASVAIVTAAADAEGRAQDGGRGRAAYCEAASTRTTRESWRSNASSSSCWTRSAAARAPDAAQYGDAGRRHARQRGRGRRRRRPAAPAGARARPPDDDPRRAAGVARRAARSARCARRRRGKDTTTGHWEMAGLRVDDAVPHLPGRLPARRSWRRSAQRTGRGVLGNKPASGTEIIEELGDRAPADRRAHRLHLGRLGLPDRRARGDRPARGALSHLPRSRARSCDECRRRRA